ncbi:fimbrial biogenesis outer membrane usher protein [Psychrobacter frigidicola]|uniref:Fimbrial biogenesis outer membrane usher protein n=1 Tax=Psychrobacter frigidicola TaxID=45611 RepID=A0A5C7A3X2_9GAMM|nr:fimbria/pilus outer membrane usher protein [Psychrobacter frigidicola]TXD97788.1 fimbrial biogenesis outer membrane usher protein [Psychrobacter frigidicola]
MELRRRQTSRWTLPLAKVVLLQCVAVSASHAVELNDIALTNQAPTPDSDSVDNELSQLNLDSYNPDDDEAGLDLYLDATLNGASAGLVHFYFRDDQLWASVAILQQLGFIIPPDSPEPIPLTSLPDLKIDYDARRQTVSLIAPLSILKLDSTILNTRTNKRPQPTASPGMLLNYNLYGNQNQNSAKNLSAYTELRAFNALGVISSTALTTANRPADSDSNSSNWNSRTVRLDTSWSKSFPDKLITVRAGDILTGALSWTRSTRLGGLQIGTNFDLQPYRSTTPLPSFFGSATLPSAVELYVNGLKQYSGNVPAGPFELNTAPSFSGAGNAQLVVTDALGQSTTLNFSLYDAHRLLQPGLSDWSLELGAVRENYGNHSFDYGSNIVASGTWRYGVSDRFTAETHAEVTNGLNNAGVGGTWILGSAGGILFVSLAGSKSQDQVGMQYSTSYSWNNRRFNIRASALGSSRDYRDVGTQYGSAPARRSEQISTGYSTQSFGRFGVSYNQVAQAQQETSQFASAYWSKSFGRRLSLSANYNHDINNSANNSASLSASLSLDRNISLSSSLQHANERNVFATDVSKSAPSAGGFGWRAQARHSLGNSANNKDSTGGLAELNYLGRYGQAQAGIRGNDGNYASYASARGALVKMGGGLFAARQINSGFAVVSTGGIANVPVLLQNTAIGTTNSRGLLLVSPLNAYQDNKIGIDPLELPADLRIDKVSIEATPTDRAGILVAFGITPVRSASVILLDHDNQPLPLGSQVRQLTNKDVPSTVVGFDGEVYLDTLDAHNVLEVTMPSDEVCTVSFDYSKQGDEIPLIGPFICQETKK